MTVSNSFKFIVRTYALALVLFSIFRVILLATNLDTIVQTSPSWTVILKAFWMGIRFDLVISSYILILPALLHIVSQFVGRQPVWLHRFIFYYVFVLFSIAFIIGTVDIPYFNQFNERFSIGAFAWVDSPSFVLSMILNEPTFAIYIVPIVGSIYLFYRRFRSIYRRTSTYTRAHRWPVAIGLSVCILLGMFLGIRGRYQKKSPIRVGTAYFSDNSFLNKLGLNPTFTLIKSYLNSTSSQYAQIDLMEPQAAIAKTRAFYNITDTLYTSPIARHQGHDTSTVSPNVIFILMESMSAAYMNSYGNTQNMTPFLDSLAHESLFFKNTYSAGIHTFNGIFSALHSQPALYRQHTMKVVRDYDGISRALKRYGYHTSYYTTHDGQFDNVEGFLYNNFFDAVYTEDHYPSSEAKTNLGVPDDYMFRFSIPHLNQLAKNQTPFFVVYMTSSNHAPFYIPEYFKSKFSDKKEQVVEYSDWALADFLTKAKDQPWYDNTLFVLMADHGRALYPVYDIAINYFYSPLIFHSPRYIQSRLDLRIASQLDAFPTTMSLLGKPFVNNTLGIDLINQSRPYVVLNADSKVGVIDSVYFCIMKQGGEKLELYRYQEKDLRDYATEQPVKAQQMAEYAKATMQTHQELIQKNHTREPLD